MCTIYISLSLYIYIYAYKFTHDASCNVIYNDHGPCPPPHTKDRGLTWSWTIIASRDAIYHSPPKGDPKRGITSPYNHSTFSNIHFKSTWKCFVGLDPHFRIPLWGTVNHEVKCNRCFGRSTTSLETDLFKLKTISSLGREILYAATSWKRWWWCVLIWYADSCSELKAHGRGRLGAGTGKKGWGGKCVRACVRLPAHLYVYQIQYNMCNIYIYIYIYTYIYIYIHIHTYSISIFIIVIKLWLGLLVSGLVVLMLAFVVSFVWLVSLSCVVPKWQYHALERTPQCDGETESRPGHLGLSPQRKPGLASIPCYTIFDIDFDFGHTLLVSSCVNNPTGSQTLQVSHSGQQAQSQSPRSGDKNQMSSCFSVPR